jgi:hypothetical protein
LLAIASCKGNGDAAQEQKNTEPQRKLAGVYPERFRCDSIVTTEALGAILGGTVKATEPQFKPPRGVASSCNYAVDPSGDAWMFDFDCRDDYKQRADALFDQYRQTSAENVAAFARIDAGAKPDRDAGPVRAPEGAVEVSVGAKGLDHHGQGLIFIDDDAPCYVRVIGPDAARRLELAKLIQKNLTFANAPMTPRPFP